MKEKNVLILGLSTMGKGAKKTYCYVEDEGKCRYLEYYYSLEPGSKYIIDKLIKSNRKLHKIILLCTPEVREEKEHIGKIIENCESKLSEVDYYKKSVEAFVRTEDIYRTEDVGLEAHITEKVDLIFDKNFDAILNAGRNQNGEKLDNGLLLYIKKEIKKKYEEMSEKINELSDEEKKKILEAADLKDYAEELINLLKEEYNEARYIELCDRYYNKYIDELEENSKVKKLKRVFYSYAKLRMEKEKNLELIKNITERTIKLQNEITRIENNEDKKVEYYIENKIVSKLDEKGILLKVSLAGGNDSGWFEDIEFADIDLVEGKEMSAISEMIKEIRGMSEEEIKVNLFVDMQGGMRTTIFTINAVLNILRHDNINVEMSTAIRYERNNIINLIEDVTRSNRIFDLVSGMDEFFSYGKGKKFCEYYEKLNSDNKGNSLLGKENDIVKNIKQVSEAIELCNPDGIMENIEELVNKIEDYEKSSVGANKDIFGSLIPLLSDEMVKEKDIVSVINWCIKKELYQQALTLIEAKLPDDMVEKGLIYYCKEGDKQQEEKAIKAFTMEREKIKNGYQIKDCGINHYFVKTIIRRDKNCLDKLGEDSMCSIWIGGNKEKYEINLNTNVDNKGKLKELLTEYFELSGLRNERNHAKNIEEKGNGLEKIKGELSLFMSNYAELRKECIGKYKTKTVSLGLYIENTDKVKLKTALEKICVYLKAIDVNPVCLDTDVLKQLVFDESVISQKNKNSDNIDYVKYTMELYDELKEMKLDMKKGQINSGNLGAINKFLKGHRIVARLVDKNIAQKSNKAEYFKRVNNWPAYKQLLYSCKENIDSLFEIFDGLEKDDNANDVMQGAI